MIRAGQTDLAIAYLTTMVKGAKNEAIKVTLATRLRALEGVRAIEGARNAYLKATGRRAVIVGGAAVSFYTNGQILSGDFDIVTDTEFESYLVRLPERREPGPLPWRLLPP